MRRSSREPITSANRYSERLLLRPFSRRDIDGLFQAVCVSKRELAEYLPWATKAYSRASAARFIKDSMQSWRETKAYDFTIRRPQDPTRHLGNVSIWHVSRTFRSGEIGYWVRSDETGLGIATEAARVVLRIGFEELNMHRIVVRVARGNISSERIARKLGFVREGVLREELRIGDRWMDHSVWGLLDHEYQHAESIRRSSLG